MQSKSGGSRREQLQQNVPMAGEGAESCEQVTVMGKACNECALG